MFFRSMRKRLDRSEEGFTLIELIVAMLIIAILAAVGAQAFLAQRRKGWVAHVHSALRHMAAAENHHIYGGGDGYTLDVAALVNTGFTFNDEYVEPLVLAADAGTFCIQMTSTRDPSIVWHFNSEVGKPQEGPGGPEECGLGSGDGTLVAGEHDPSGNTPGSAKVDTDGDGLTNDEDPDDDNDGVSDEDEEDGDEGNEGNPDPNSTPNPENTPPPPGSLSSPPPPPGGESSPPPGPPPGPPPVTVDDPSDDRGGGGCRGDRNDPDGDNNGGRDEIGGSGGNDPDRDCNNGSGNDDDGDDDNNAGGKGK
jgi:prepilin-type N-terminal cleavage/methylation domain-containing protein